ncbi:uncharacterized protein LOC116764761 isoform X3 [Phocoena sinus]|uniref:uncharacterized protein LOC116764761 isoform X3 n=1 Tax=Phocoena sinus TaxID=42100 RepID=UPI0013C4C275|nr:uncharacterized protein LOC116764761 isoform X3 [Phocoena sinus]XP_032509568.1 uncharacterized protein LOC116764761 isoform X3 [Phocoena sinus]XP_032509569.1 uncharacterized protein LOC116764761 isoform X3 [Phocoena sinus]
MNGTRCEDVSTKPQQWWQNKHFQLPHPSYKEEMCLGWRPTFRSSTSFLPKEPSPELPTVFTRKPSNNTLDLRAWPNHRRGLPRPENHPSESLAHGGVSLFLLQNVKNVKLVSFFLSFNSWENSCQWTQCPFQIQYCANCVSANGVNKYVHGASGCTERWGRPDTEMQTCRLARELLKLPLHQLCYYLSPSEQGLRAWGDGPLGCPAAGDPWSHAHLGWLQVGRELSLAAVGTHHLTSPAPALKAPPSSVPPKPARLSPPGKAEEFVFFSSLFFEVYFSALSPHSGRPGQEAVPHVASFWHRELGRVPFPARVLVSRRAVLTWV